MNTLFKLLKQSLAVALLTLSLGAGTAQAADSLRPEVGKPLKAAQDLIKAQKFTDALAKIKETDPIPNKTPYETLVIEQMRGAAAAGAGDMDTAGKAFDAVIATGKLPPDQQLKIMQAVAGGYYRAKDYPKAIAWVQKYQKAGGNDPGIALLLIQSEYLSGDYADAAKAMQDQVTQDQKAGKTPKEEDLQMLASCYLKQNDGSGYVGALEQLVTWYPKKDYWADLLTRVQRKPGFSERLELDVYRLMQATGNLKTADDYMEMAQLALQAGFPSEAQKVIDDGYAKKILGQGQEAARQKRLKDLADKQAQDDQKTLDQDTGGKTGEAQIATGYNLVINGKADKGLKLMQQGLSQGGLKHPEDARLHLGEAYLIAGRTEEANKQFHQVQGNDGAQDLAKLFALTGKGKA
jgi:outer membrane protein assembly factor BamD (BamD/ComL family)